MSKSWQPGQVRANPALAPVRIARGTFGAGLPKRDLLVSRQHRILMRSPIVERMFGQAEVLVPAHALLALPGVSVAAPDRPVTYVHVMLDRHEIVFAEGLPAETLYLGAQALASIPRAGLAEIAALLGRDLRELAQQPPAAARPLVRGRRAGRLVARHLRNAQPPLRPVATALDLLPRSA